MPPRAAGSVRAGRRPGPADARSGSAAGAGRAPPERTSSQTGTRPRYSDQRLRGSTTAPPPGEITRRSSGGASAGPRATTASRSRRRKAASPSSAKISGIGRPAACSISSSRSTNVAPWRAARRRPTAVLPLPGSPTRTRSIGRVRRRRRSRRRRGRSRRRRHAAGARARPGDPLAVPAQVVGDLGHRVAAGLLEHEPGEREHDHRLADHARRRDHRDVAALVVGLVHRLAGDAGPPWAAGRASVEIGLTAPRTTIGSPLVTPPVRPPALLERWIQVPSSRRPSITSWTCEPNRRVCSKPRPELHALDDVDAHHGRGQRRVQAPVPVDVAAEPDRRAVDDDLEHAAHGVAVRRAPRRCGRSSPVSASGSGQRSGEASASSRDRVRAGRIHGHAAHLGRERPDLDARARAGTRGRCRRRRPARPSRARTSARGRCARR